MISYKINTEDVDEAEFKAIVWLDLKKKKKLT